MRVVRRRGRTENPARLSGRRLRLLAAEAPPIDVERPAVRGDCAGVERPCPFVGCAHNLYLDVNEETGAIKYNRPDLEPGDVDPDWSCALDVAERGEQTREAVGASMNLVPERIRQIFRAALSKMHLAGGAALRLLHEAGEPSRAHSMAEQLEQHAMGKGGVELGEHPEGWRDVAGTNRGVQEAVDLAEAAAWANEVHSYVSQGLGLRDAWSRANSYPCRHYTTDEAVRRHGGYEERKKSMAAKKATNGGAPKGAVERDRFHEMLPCTIESTEDLQAVANTLAQVMREHRELKDRKRAANAAFREKLNFYDEREAELAEAVESRKEKRKVEVVEYLLPNNEVQVVRTDTGEVVRTRTANAADLQDEIPFEDGGEEDGKGKPKRGGGRKGRPSSPASEEASPA